MLAVGVAGSCPRDGGVEVGGVHRRSPGADPTLGPPDHLGEAVALVRLASGGLPQHHHGYVAAGELVPGVHLTVPVLPHQPQAGEAQPQLAEGVFHIRKP